MDIVRIQSGAYFANCEIVLCEIRVLKGASGANHGLTRSECVINHKITALAL